MLEAIIIVFSLKLTVRFGQSGATPMGNLATAQQLIGMFRYK
jgi:hypothetical protein